jgi:MATE family multidrug resistance protein
LSDLRRDAAATLRLAGPLIGGQLAYLGLSVIDTVMAGNLSAETLAAVAVGSSLWASLNVFLLGVLMSVSAFVAQDDGEGTDEARARIAPFTRQALWVALGLAAVTMVEAHSVRPLLTAMDIPAALVPTITGYLRALTWGMPAWTLYLTLRFFSEGLGATRPTLWIGLLGLPANAFANWVLMYGGLGMPALGAVGCGHATAVVWCLELVAMAVYVALHPRYREHTLFGRFDAPQLATVREILRVGLPVGVALVAEVGMFTAVAVVMGSLGTVTVAGHQVALNFTALLFMIPLGVSMAVTVRVANAVGRRDAEGVRRAGWVGVGLALVIQSVNALLMLTLPRSIAGLYTDDPAVISTAARLLFFAALFQISDGLQISSSGALRGLKDTRVPMLVTGVAYWGVGLPTGLVLAFPVGLGAQGLWIGLITGLTVAAVPLCWRFAAVSGRLAERFTPPPSEDSLAQRLGRPNPKARRHPS